MENGIRSHPPRGVETRDPTGVRRLENGRNSRNHERRKPGGNLRYLGNEHDEQQFFK